MEVNIYIILILVLIIGNTTFSIVLSLLDFYNKSPIKYQKQAKAKQYLRSNINLSISSNIVGNAILLIIIFSGLLNFVDIFLRNLIQNESLVGLLFFGIFGGAIFILDLPFSIYRTFYLEKKYGFNKSTPGLFFKDTLKTICLWILVGSIGLLPLFVLFNKFGPEIWIYCWILVILLQLFTIIIFPRFVMPMFNKFKILPDGELKSAISNYLKSQKINISIDNIKVVDSSKRSTKSSASLVGLLYNKRIILSDTLIKNHSTEEIVAIVAHEVGHNEKNHIFKKFLFYLFESFIMFYFLSLFLTSNGFFLALGVENFSVHVSLFIMSILYIPLAFVFSVVSNIMSRRFELSADAFSAETYSSKAMASALSKLEVDNLTNPTPSKLKVFIDYTHPPISQRVSKLREIEDW